MRVLTRYLAIVAGVMAGLAMSSSSANAGDFTVSECSGSGGADSSIYVENPSTPGFSQETYCPVGTNGIRAGGATNPGDTASVRYEALQGTGFLGAKFWYYHQDANGVSAKFLFNNAGGANTEQVTGLLPQGTLWGGASFYDVSDAQPRTYFRATLRCDRPVNPCGTGAGIALQYLELKVRDSLAPSTADFLGGTLFDPGTVSGTRTAFVGGIDNGSGVSAITLNVNDVWTHWAAPTCNLAGLRPCPRDPTTTFNVNTGSANFVNGVNKITLCVQDYATSGSTNAKCENRYINVAK